MTEDTFVFEMCADYRIGRLHMLLDPWVTIAKLRLFRDLSWKTLTSPRRVQMATLVSACQRARLPLADER